MPGLVFTAVVMWCCGVQGLTRVGFPAALICTVLGAGNGIYYMGQVHGNYHRKDAELAAQAAAAAALDPYHRMHAELAAKAAVAAAVDY